MESKSAQEYGAKMLKEGQKWSGRRGDDRNRSRSDSMRFQVLESSKEDKGTYQTPGVKGEIWERREPTRKMVREI